MRIHKFQEAISAQRTSAHADHTKVALFANRLGNVSGNREVSLCIDEHVCVLRQGGKRHGGGGHSARCGSRGYW